MLVRTPALAGSIALGIAACGARPVIGGAGGVSAVELTPATPAPTDTVRCSLRGDDVDRAGAAITWEIDGARIPHSGPTLDLAPLGLSPGARVGCALLTRVVKADLPLRATTVVREPSPPWVGGNLLVLVADDVGVDKVGAYAPRGRRPATPELDRLAARGVRFDRAYANSVCSPTRATVLTGRVSRRTGIGRGVHALEEDVELSLDELTLPELLARGGYRSAALGKWHLAGRPAGHLLDHPRLSGFDTFRGTISNLLDGVSLDGEPQDYDDWEKVVDGEVTRTRRYATTDTVDDALALGTTLAEPWVLYVAFHAPHEPLHVPPAHLVSHPVGPSPADRYDAMVEALDAEIGRLLRGLGERLGRTTVVFVGDNGTSEAGVRPPGRPDRAKGTLYEGGVHVPLLVAGPAVARPGAHSAALVQTTDLFATAAELAGVPLPATRDDGRPLRLDSVSLVPYLRDPDLPSLRDVVYVERFGPNRCAGGPACDEDGRALIGARWKFVSTATGASALYDLARDEAEVPAEGKVVHPVRALMRARLGVLEADLREDRTWAPLP